MTKIINLDSFGPKSKYFGIINTSVGEFDVYYVSYGDRKDVEKDLGKSYLESTPTEYLSALSRYICFPHDDSRKEKPKKTDVVKPTYQLSELELNELAKLLIHNEEYLIKESISEDYKDENGKLVSKYTYGKIIKHKADSEDYIQYYYRLLKEYDDETFKNFSTSLGVSMKELESLAEKISKPIRNPQGIGGMFDSRIPDSLMGTLNHQNKFDIDFQAMEESSLRPFNRLGDQLGGKIDELTELTAQNIQVQMRIAGELKSSSDQASKSSSVSVRLNLFVIVLTFLALIISGYTAYMAIFKPDKSVVNKLDELIEVTVNNNHIYDDKIDKQEQMINKLVEQNKIQADMINKLNKELNIKQNK